ncbi:MAG: hypothetical protein ACI8PW_000818 [Methylophilaceae bacterium]|jgi:hypothetical protein
MNQIEPYNINTVLNIQTSVPAYIRQELQHYLAGDTDIKDVLSYSKAAAITSRVLLFFRTKRAYSIPHEYYI